MKLFDLITGRAALKRKLQESDAALASVFELVCVTNARLENMSAKVDQLLREREDLRKLAPYVPPPHALYIVAFNQQWACGQALFMGANRRGYTVDLDQAALHTESEAREICSARPSHVAVPAWMIGQLRVRRVIDMNDSLNTHFSSPQDLRGWASSMTAKAVQA